MTKNHHKSKGKSRETNEDDRCFRVIFDHRHCQLAPTIARNDLGRDGRLQGLCRVPMLVVFICLKLFFVLFVCFLLFFFVFRVYVFCFFVFCCFLFFFVCCSPKNLPLKALYKVSCSDFTC